MKTWLRAFTAVGLSSMLVGAAFADPPQHHHGGGDGGGGGNSGGSHSSGSGGSSGSGSGGGSHSSGGSGQSGGSGGGSHSSGGGSYSGGSGGSGGTAHGSGGSGSPTQSGGSGSGSNDGIRHHGPGGGSTGGSGSSQGSGGGTHSGGGSYSGGGTGSHGGGGSWNGTSGGGTHDSGGSGNGGSWNGGNSGNSGGHSAPGSWNGQGNRGGNSHSGGGHYGGNNNLNGGNGGGGFRSGGAWIQPGRGTIQNQVWRSDHLRFVHNNEWRSGYWGYNRGWRDDNFFFGFYSFDPFGSRCVVSPWYCYPNLPGYLSYDRVLFFGCEPIVFIGDSYNWRPVNYDNYYGNDSRYNDVDYAVGDLSTLFQRADRSALNRLVPRRENVNIFVDGQYSYSISPNDFYDMMVDNAENTRTISYTIERVWRNRDGARVLARHEFEDPRGGTCTVWQSYVLEYERGDLVIREFGTSNNRPN